MQLIYFLNLSQKHLCLKLIYDLLYIISMDQNMLNQILNNYK